MRLAHARSELHAETDQNGRLLYHPSRYDESAGPIGLFFLHYYPLVLTIAGLLLFAGLQLRAKKQ